MNYRLSTEALQLCWSEAPWDEVVCGFPVFQITDMRLHAGTPSADFEAFEVQRDHRGVGLVSCRLAHEHMRESMFLESRGFRFIEMVYRPEIELARLADLPVEQPLLVRAATAQDLPELCEIAGSSFRNERFRMDPRLAPEISDQRYRNWVSSSLNHPRQRLRVVCDGDLRIAFFVIELLDDGTCYWHLNAVAPAAQGRGYGRRAWLAMLAEATAMGAQRVQSSIVARNVRVINLYAGLGFRFSEPTMTFHWVRTDAAQ
ncbi:GNAT family N-acetyltransferase [Roseateles toxinivorans]|uniref:RimJ/RimL family protein N-acetyltransferase n=1 Tax=Roseateles toxinivorans TaxID=270368 RepID=A0A4R6QUM0_9BURK|nr:GNAT family N-acetyltransferase [Roseateles toxinivorans]TDP74632.1 RimJ/RimL family protein N-acetyltransferase [Roseateles toxinivorans]